MVSKDDTYNIYFGYICFVKEYEKYKTVNFFYIFLFYFKN